MAIIAVIGAGVAGMSCAARLAVKGHDVVVFEKHNSPGGSTSQIRFQEYGFDIGQTYLTLPATFRDLFLKTGGPLEDEVQFLDADKSFAFHFSDGSSLVLPSAGVGASIEAIRRDLGDAAATQWREYMKACADMWAVNRTTLFETQPKNVLELLTTHKSIKWFRRAGTHQSLLSFNKAHLTDRRLIEFAEFYAQSTGGHSQNMSASLAVLPYLEETFGVHHIRNGVSELSRALYRRCIQLGVRFNFDTEIIHVEKLHEKFHITTSNNEIFTADLVVSDVSITTTLTSLISSNLRTRKTAQVMDFAQTHTSCSEFVLLLALAGETENIASHNVWISHHMPQFLDSSIKTPTTSEPVTIYAHVPADPSMRPAKGEAWRISIQVPLHNPGEGLDWTQKDLIENTHTFLLSTLVQNNIDIEKRILWQQVLTPADFEQRNSSPGGARFGVTTPHLLGMVKRPRNQSPIKGLYFVGSGTHPGGALPFQAMSANAVAQAIGSAK